MTVRMYNAIWVYPEPAEAHPLPAPRRLPQVVAGRGAGVSGFILYPWTATPGTVLNDDWIELIILTKDATLRPENVNRQLKFSPGMDPRKPYAPAPLFANLTDQIEIGPATSFGSRDEEISTHERFFGRVDARARQLIRSIDFTRLYKVRVASSCLDPNLATPAQLNEDRRGLVRPKEWSDFAVTRALRSGRTGNGRGLRHRGLWGFNVGRRGANVNSVDADSPIQSYHPVFHYPQSKQLNFGHVSDIHVNVRQAILKKSPARVIDYAANGSAADEDVSPKLGEKLNIYDANVNHILRRFGQLSSVDAVCVGGDLIDHAMNAYHNFRGQTPSAADVWDAVSLDEDGYEDRYQRFPDMIAFFSIVMSFYRRYKKPLFAISGNHDCYQDAYGISPRVAGIRANEGIPADHNLTLYEAILMFGETYDEVINTSNFQPNLFAWFYSVFTPFSDYHCSLPEQELVGLAWGEQEDLLDVPGWSSHGLGHLPRSDEAVTDAQLALLRRAVRSDKHVVLSTHFTFASYHDSIPLYRREEGDIEFDISWDPSQYDFGTFETNRRELYEDMIGGRQISCILTGHSHRRGLYYVTNRDYTFDNSVTTQFYDFNEMSRARRNHAHAMKPAIIVSDSGGPVPRQNLSGEFEGWGSDNPSGSAVEFDSNGVVSRVRTVPARVKPRLAVALEYYIFVGAPSRAPLQLFDDFRTDYYQARAEQRNELTEVSIELTLARHLVDRLELSVERVVLYGRRRPGQWVRIEPTYDAGSSRWLVGRDSIDAYKQFLRVSRASRFVALKFSSEHQRISRNYDLDDFWTFPIKMRNQLVSGSKRQLFQRTRASEIPNFDWRREDPIYQS